MEHWKDKLKLRLPALVLLVVTLLFWSKYDRFEPIGPALLESATLADATRYSGDVAEEGGCFCLTVPSGGGRAQVRFRFPESTQHDYIRVRARMKTDQVVVGKASWHCARIIFAQYDADNRWMPGNHGLLSESGTMKRAYREQVFEMFSDAAYGEVAIQQYGLSGSAEFDRIEVQPVRLWPLYAWWRALFFVLWLGMLALYFPRCRMNTRRLKVLILLNAIAILYGTMMPSLYITTSSEWVKDSLRQAVEKSENSKPPPAGGESVDSVPPAAKKSQEDSRMDQLEEVVGEAHQLGHFILFASLCFLVYWSAALEKQHRSYYLKVIFDILLFAAITESLQQLTLDRTAGLQDLLIDVYGMLTALLFFIITRVAASWIFPAFKLTLVILFFFIRSDGWASEAQMAEEPAPDSVLDLRGAFQKTIQGILDREVLFPYMKDALDEHAPVLSGMTATMEPRFYYFKRDNPNGTTSEAFAGGGRLHVDSGWLYDFISVGGSYYRSDKIMGDKDEGGTGLLAPGQKSFDVLGEAYLALRYEEHRLKLYRQTLDLPYLNKTDSRMVPNTFEAYMLEGRLEEQPVVGDVEYVVGYVDQVKRRTADQFISMSEAAGVEGGDRGLVTAGALFQPHTNYTMGAINHYVDDVLNTFYLESNYTRKMTEELDLRFDAQFTHQQSVGADRLTGNDFNTWQLGGRIASSWKGLTLTAAATKIDDEQRMRNPYGSYPGYTGMMLSDFKLANTQAWLLGASYDFSHIGLKGLSSFFNYVDGRSSKSKMGMKLPDQKEFDITADYKVTEGLLRGFWLRVRWANLNFSDDTDDTDELRIILNYSLPLL